MKAVVDRVNTTGAVWLGLTVGCAECHSHKYDPLSHHEYYGLYAFFNNADESDVRVPPTEHDRALYADAKRAYDRALQELENDLAAYRERLTQNMPELEGDLRAVTAAGAAVPAPVAAALQVPAERRTPAQSEALLAYLVETNEGVRTRSRSIDAHRRTEPRPGEALAMTLTQRSASFRETRVHLRGDFLKPGDPVTPHTPAVLPPLHSRGPVPDRLDLARWLVEPNNPLTARVTVNRAWHHLFGRGLVPTVEDFGLMGDPPSHRELLDYLASVFVSGSGLAGEWGSGEVGKWGSTRRRQLRNSPTPAPTSLTPPLPHFPTSPPWSQKALLRLIVTSATYRRSSRVRPELAERDPRNELLGRQNRLRLEAESVRDAALAASGLLNPRMGGPGFRPPLPKGLTDVAFRLDLSYTPDEGSDLYRRGVYLFIKRNLLNPLLTTFDGPDATSTCTRRPRSNTPLQALALLNDPLFLDCARALGRRLQEAPGPDEARVTAGFRRCVARAPSATELRSLLRLNGDLHAVYAADPAEAARLVGQPLPPAEPERASIVEAATWTAVARTLLNLDELVTRE